MLELAFRVEVSDGRGGIDLEDVTVTVLAKGTVPPMMENPDPTKDTRVNGAIAGACVCSHTESTRGGGPWLIGLLFAVLVLRRGR
jgi:hypothetical protein